MKRAVQLRQSDESGNQKFNHEKKESLRINKYLTAAGFCSRRQADKFINEGIVRIDDAVASLGTQVFSDQIVTVNGERVSLETKHVYIALNKPIGITCTTESDIKDNIIDFMNHERRIFPVGRLDKDSSGLILLTSDGDIVNKILRSENNHEKEYIVKVDRTIKSDFIKRLRNGIEITNTKNNTRVMTKGKKVHQIGPKTFKIVLTQGLNRQIRRMCTECGYHVVTLERIRIMNVHLDNLKIGQWRYLTQQELNELNLTL